MEKKNTADNIFDLLPFMKDEDVMKIIDRIAEYDDELAELIREKINY